jgi:16S rRNA processing protein RimM
MALVGRIARPHGLRGQVVINPETDFVEERFAPGASVWTRSPRGEALLTVASMRVQNGRPVVGFTGFDRIEDVEGLAGQELRVPDTALQPLEAGMYYEHQLAGCCVETVGGDIVGEVSGVEGGAGATRLAINGPRGEILIPLAMDICVEIDVVNKRIRIEPPDGLLELNEKGPAKAGLDDRRNGPAKSGPHDQRAHARRGRL